MTLQKPNKGAVLITGASTGIGLACALHLDALGHRVFAGVRKQADADDLDARGSGRLSPLILDVTDAAQIKAAFEVIARELDGAPLAGLVNNAGIGLGGPLEFLPLEDLRWQLEVNLIGQVAVTQAAIPLLRRGAGRIVNIGSIGGKIASPLMAPYCASKFALEAVTDVMRYELAPWGIFACVVEPGQIITPIWGKATADLEAVQERYTPEARAMYAEAIAGMARKIKTGASKGVPAERVAEAVAHALNAKSPKTRYLVGPDARGGAFMRWLLPDALFDRFLKKVSA